jgi:hypothetical protein
MLVILEPISAMKLDRFRAILKESERQVNQLRAICSSSHNVCYIHIISPVLC